ncbi:MAG: phosphate signaling complex protein PhoU [Armatimonadaceae bacterium]
MSATGQRFEEELSGLRARLVEMGTATEEIVRDSIIALTTQNMGLAATIIPRDDAIDRMDMEIETLCLRLMARYQPVAANLRLVGASLKVITDIERIGDHAVDISRISQRMSRDMVYKPLVDIPRMGEMARAMLHDSINAFIHSDMVMVEHVLRGDDQVDELYARMRRELQEIMQSDPTSVMQASYLLFVAHYIERICDHCCNIVERVAFIETGRLHGQVPILQPDNPATAENRAAQIA